MSNVGSSFINRLIVNSNMQLTNFSNVYTTDTVWFCLWYSLHIEVHLFLWPYDECVCVCLCNFICRNQWWHWIHDMSIYGVILMAILENFTCSRSQPVCDRKSIQIWNCVVLQTNKKTCQIGSFQQKNKPTAWILSP